MTDRNEAFEGLRRKPQPDTIGIYDLSCGQFEYRFLDAFEGWTLEVDGRDYRLISNEGYGRVVLAPWDNENDCLADVPQVTIDLSDGNHTIGVY